MPRSSGFNRAINATGGSEAPRILLQIDHPTFSVPIRVVNDNLDLTSNGNLFVALAFDITLPDDFSGQLPVAKLSMDNVGREIVDPLEASGGGEGATVRVMQVLRSAPDAIEWEATLDLKNVQIPPGLMRVTADLGYEDILNKPAVLSRHDPITSPGLF